jgi:hypothetical protein
LKPATPKRFGFRRALELWWTLRAIVKIARRPMPERCDLCGHSCRLHDARGCVVHDSEGPCLCPRSS